MLDLNTSRRHIIFNGISDSYHDLAMVGDTSLLLPEPKRSSVELSYTNGTIDTSELNGELYFNDHEIEYVFICKIPTVYNGVARTTAQMNGLCNDKIKAVESWAYSGPATLNDYGMPRVFEDADCTSVVAEKAISTECWIVKFTLHFRCPYNMSLSTATIPYKHDFDGRYIVYNGYISSNIGLVMIGSTPLTDVEPKTKYMEWPKRNGALNLSHVNHNLSSGYESLFYKDRSIKYQFVHFINKGSKDICAMNVACQEYIEAVCKWLYYHSTTLPFTTVDGNVTYGGTELMLIDSGWINPNYDPSVGGDVQCNCLPSARCTGLSVTKTMFPDKWGLTFDVTFTTYPRFSNCTLYIPPASSQTHEPEIEYVPWANYASTFTNEQNTKTLMCEVPSYANNSGLYLAMSNEEFTKSWAFSEYVVTAATGSILCSYDIDIPEYIDDSIPENYPCVAITVSPFVDITCNGVTKTYLAYQASGYGSLYVGYDLYYEGSSSPSNMFYPAIIFDDEFSYSGISVYLYPIGPTGMVAEEGFTAAELEADDTIITINFKYHYLKYTAPANIQSEYGLWANDEDYCPNEYYIFTKYVADFRDDPPEYTTDAISFIPFNKPNQQGDYKFDHPGAYTTQGPNGWACWLDVPLVNGIGNNYIWCDTAKPEGCDIQWL